MRRNTPSRTAQVVALGTLCVAHEPRFARLVPDETRAALTRILRANGLGIPALGMRLPPFRRYAEKKADKVVPGILLHYALRKRAIAEAVQRAVGEGVRQLVVLGSGLDPLGILAARKHRIPVWEVDCSDNLDAKRRIADGIGVRFQTLDLLDPQFADRLQSAGWSPAKATVFVCEGVFMYLPESAATSLLKSLNSPGSVFVFTLLELSPEGAPNFRSSANLAEWLDKVGEPFRFGMHVRDVRDWLEEAGWTSLEVLEGEDLRERFLPGSQAATAIGEYVVVARARGSRIK